MRQHFFSFFFLFQTSPMFTMLRSVVFFVVIVGALAACPPSIAPGTYTFGVTIQNRNRTFILHVPPQARTSTLPLFFNFHGFNNDAGLFCTNSGIKTLANSEGFIAICAYGFQKSWNGGDCCGTAPALQVDDVAFTRAMVAEVKRLLCLDEQRIFAAGYSNGGFMSYRLACEASDIIRAIGPVAGLLSSERSFSCASQVKPVPVIHFHGTSDPVIRYADGAESVERYKDISGCTGAPVVTFQNRTATCETYKTCRNKAEVVFCSIQGQEHAWPGCSGPPGSGAGCNGNTQDINATKEMWAFFKRMSGL